MGVLDRLDHTHVRAAVVGFRDALRAHQGRLNRLNVYPVPDGDTGTNMALTLESVVTALDGVAEPRDMVTTCKAISHGSLMGARGNSGVILSQVLRGLCARLDDAECGRRRLGGGGPGRGQHRRLLGGDASGGGHHPHRGAGGVGGGGGRASEAGGAGEKRLVDVLDAAARSARDSLARTPDLLPVLKEAGVVDAGGAGFVLFLDALLQVVDGRPVPEAPEGEPEPTVGVGQAAPHGGDGGIEGPRYEVMYLLEAPDDKIDAFKATWMDIGESIVIVGGDGLWNCHIHADDIGASIEAGIEAGRPRQIRVTDLPARWRRSAGSARAWAPPTGRAAGPGHGWPRRWWRWPWATPSGDGFRSLGAQEVVVGGQTMNPSTADLLEAIEATDADEVVLLPNNKNIVPVARQAADLASKPVRVVPTRGMVAGLAAMFAYDADAPADANAKSMEEAAAAGRVGAGHVGGARFGSHQRGRLAGSGAGRDRGRRTPTSPPAPPRLLDRLVDDAHELVTVSSRAATPDEVTEAVGRVAGGQPARA